MWFEAADDLCSLDMDTIVTLERGSYFFGSVANKCCKCVAAVCLCACLSLYTHKEILTFDKLMNERRQKLAWSREGEDRHVEGNNKN